MQKRDLSLLALRLVIAAIFLWHGVPKLLHVGSSMEMFARLGLAGWLGPIIGCVEAFASGMLVLGFKHRWAASALLVVIVGAILIVQLPRGLTSSLERDTMIFAGLIVLFFETRLGYSIGADE
ncbi:MAG: DoxX family protein [Gemmatimonadales bacterium]|nr:MAG: DoxX family protein [Gemmatimonadales bacterium]